MGGKGERKKMTFRKSCTEKGAVGSKGYGRWKMRARGREGETGGEEGERKFKSKSLLTSLTELFPTLQSLQSPPSNNGCSE